MPSLSLISVVKFWIYHFAFCTMSSNKIFKCLIFDFHVSERKGETEDREQTEVL